MNTSAVLGELAAAGVNAWPESRNSFATDSGKRIVVSFRRRPPTPVDIEHDLARVPDDRMLYSVRSLTPGLRRAVLRDDRLIVFVTDSNSLWLDRREHRPTIRQAPAVRRGRKPFVQFAIARSMLLAPGHRRQVDLADEVGAGQPVVSHALQKMTNLFERTPSGVRVRDWGVLWDFFATDYPGAGGITTYWWHDGALDEQAQRVQRVAADRDIEALVSGDLAARAIAPWRRPEHVTMYLGAGVDPSVAGFALASPADHTLSITVPDDRTIFATAASHPAGPGHVDAVLAALDVSRTGTTGDQDEAANRIRIAVLSQWRKTPS